MGAEINSFFKVSNALMHSDEKMNVTSLARRFVRPRNFAEVLNKTPVEAGVAQERTDVPYILGMRKVGN